MEHQLCDNFVPNWLRPYIIKNKFFSRAYHLVYMEGNKEHELINISHIHPFYSIVILFFYIQIVNMIKI